MSHGDRDYDAVVVGGGIVGCASAFYLAERGLDVVLVERGEIAHEQSSRNWGFIRQQGRHPVELPLMIESIRMWSGLEQRLEADLEWTQGGNLALASDEAKLGRFEEWARMAGDHGLVTEIVPPSKLTEHLPLMSGEFAGGMYTASDGHANPHLVSAAYAAAAARAGVKVLTHEAVEAVLVTDGSVSGVRTEGRALSASVVVCAAGALSSKLLRTIGVPLPQRVVRATVATTAPLPRVTRSGVWADDVAFRQARDGRIVFAAGAAADYDLSLDVFRHLRQFLPSYRKNRALFRFKVGRPLLHDLGALAPWSDAARHPFSVRTAIEAEPNGSRVQRGRAALTRMFPSLGPIAVERSWAGNVDATPDGIPVIDRLAEPGGLVVATGFSGHGFALGPITGRLVAELVCDRSTSLDLHAMRIARFAEGDLVPARAVL